MKTARLLVTYDCLNDCEGCCNKDWKYDPPKLLTRYDQLTHYDEILITGGEPLLFLDNLVRLIRDIRFNSDAKIYVYTAEIDGFCYIANYVDGMTLTLHTLEDVASFQHYWRKREDWFQEFAMHSSFRINTFQGLFTFPKLAKVKYVEWIKDCPLPAHEDFWQLPILWTR